MEGRALLVRSLIRRRNELADDIGNELSAPTGGGPSLLLIRSLVTAISRAIDESAPEPVLAWGQMVRSQHSGANVSELIDAACSRTMQLGEGLEIDYSALVVFLEIVKTTSAQALVMPARPKTGPGSERHSEVIEGVLAMLKARDEATCAHSHATGAWCRRLTTAMGLPASTADLIVQAGVLHDIGKIGTPDQVLFKPGPLDESEWKVMREHAAFGSEILRELPSLARCAAIVRAHHERYDGGGYPDRLKGDEIPFEARVVAVADAFHAMISARPYRQPIGQREALRILREGSGTQWDPKIVEAMVTMLEQPQAQQKRAVAQG